MSIAQESFEGWIPESVCDNCDGATAQNCAYVRRMYSNVSSTGNVSEVQLINMKLDAATALTRIIRCNKTYEEVYKELVKLDKMTNL